MPVTVSDQLEQLERQRAGLVRQLDDLEAGDGNRMWTDGQRVSAQRYMRRALAEFNVLISDAKKKVRRRGESVHLF
jgi:hypothetical protein